MARPVIAVFGASITGEEDDDYAVGVRCGSLLAAAGFDVATGGYQGMMEAVSRGARDGGATVLGVTAPSVFPDRSGPNRFITEEHPATDLVDRLRRITAMSAAAITLPGSLGTLTELLLAWNLAYVTRFRTAAPKPVVTVGTRWAELIEHLVVTLDTDRSLVHTAADVDEAVAVVRARIP